MKTLTVLTILTAAVVVTATLLGCGEGQEMGMEIGKDIISESDAPNPAPTATKVAEVKKEEGLEPETEPLEPEPEAEPLEEVADLELEPVKESEPEPEPLEPEQEPIEPDLVEPSAGPTTLVSFRILESLEIIGKVQLGLGGVRVTPISGSTEEAKETGSHDSPDHGDHGKVTFLATLPLTVRLEKDGFFTTEVTVEKDGQGFALKSKPRTIKFWVVRASNRPGPALRSDGGVSGVRVTPISPSDEGTKVTDSDGSVTFLAATTPFIFTLIKNEGDYEIKSTITHTSLQDNEANGRDTVVRYYGEGFNFSIRVVGEDGLPIEGVAVISYWRHPESPVHFTNWNGIAILNFLVKVPVPGQATGKWLEKDGYKTKAIFIQDGDRQGKEFVLVRE